ncbi:MAG: phosphoribosylformylglycinamidine synthase subunit PurL, partial [Actinomycetota bacterium]|nr:phosphoribosylformylglycinamidine synthase subunit PurL [Actinomycetota bacterium]
MFDEAVVVDGRPAQQRAAGATTVGTGNDGRSWPEEGRDRPRHRLAPVTGDLDTVDRATTTPDAEQPWRDLGLKADEYARIRDILGRRPSNSELAMYSVMWSEHCSYKSSKVHLRQFGEKAPATEALLVGIGENAGAVDIGDGLAAVFK